MRKGGRLKTVFQIAASCLLAAICSGANRRVVDAAKEQDLAALRALLQSHADVNAAQGDGATALHWAAHWNSLATTKLLIRFGAKVNAANDLGVTPLSLACVNANPELVGVLLAAGADANLARRNGETPLMTAAVTGNVEVVKLLLSYRARVNEKEKSRGQTALMLAAATGQAEVAKLLIAAGAEVKARSTHRFTPLLFAAQQGNVETARALLTAGADANDAAPDGIGGDTNAQILFKPNTEAGALLVAIDSGHQEMARFLIGKGADVNQHGAGRVPLHAAVQQQLLEIAQLLLERGANPDSRLEKPLPRLSRAILQDAGVDTNVVGATPFWLAADFGDVQMMRLLVKHGADPLLTTVDKTTPLMAASCVDFVDGQDRYGRRLIQPTNMPLQLAAIEASKLALELGNGINATNDNGLTAMHGAAYTGSTILIQFLFDHGAKLNHANKLGQTPYYITQGVYQSGSYYTRPEAGELLRKLGADVTIGAELKHRDQVGR